MQQDLPLAAEQIKCYQKTHIFLFIIQSVYVLFLVYFCTLKQRIMM